MMVAVLSPFYRRYYDYHCPRACLRRLFATVLSSAVSTRSRSNSFSSPSSSALLLSASQSRYLVVVEYRIEFAVSTKKIRFRLAVCIIIPNTLF